MTVLIGTKISTALGRPFEITASANLVKQLPLIGKYVPEISTAFPGTINLRLDDRLLVANFDCRTPAIDWEGKGNTSEIFDLVGAQLEVRGEKHDGWLYVAHGSRHRKELRDHEFIARTKITISDGDRCELHIFRECNTVPYLSIVVVV